MIKDAFNGNWVGDRMGQIEELTETVNLLSDGLIVAIELLIENNIIEETQFIDRLENGHRIRK